MHVPKVAKALLALREELDFFEKTLARCIQRKRKVMSSSNSQPQVADLNRISSRLSQTPIAIVGMSSIFPDAQDLEAFWHNVLHEVDCITDVPESRWDVGAYYDPDPRAPDKTYCKRGGFIPDIDFDPMEFGLPPNLLEVTDVSQLLALVAAKRAMEDADCGQAQDFDRAHTGVILGAVGRQLSAPLSARLQYPIWERVLESHGVPAKDIEKIIETMKLAYVRWEENSFPGMLSNLIAGRIANRFDLGGINCTLDAACASSLAAFKMAISELVERRCNVMLTGGVDTDNSAFTYLCFSKTPALSRTQQSRPFDAESDGMILGEGIGMVVLKRLEDAERDNDRIYAVIRGIGVSSDGRYKSIYAPRPEGQVKALQRAYEDADISPATVGLIEAHGTGTMAGDPAEVAALKAVFTQSQSESSPKLIALGSVKSQIGHTKTAAGVASVIKVALALHHKVLPATLNVNQPNPKLELDKSPFYINSKTRPWLCGNSIFPRRAGVSSFGFGGTNFHVVLEEYQQEQHQRYRLNPSPKPLLLAAATPEALAARCREVLANLQSEDSYGDFQKLVQQCRSLEIPVEAARVGFVADSLQDARNKLRDAINFLQASQREAWEHPRGIYYRRTGLNLTGKVVALFPGQGSQYLEMGRELAINSPEFRQLYTLMDQQLSHSGLQPVSQVVFPAPSFEEEGQQAQMQQLKQTEYAQPAIGVFSVGLYKLLEQAGFRPDFVAGHSFGELTALWAAGAISDADYFYLVKHRGQAMAVPNGTDAGVMLAVTGEAAEIEAMLQHFPQVAIANFNSSRQVVLAGAKANIVELQQQLEQRGYTAVLLPVSAAFHTPLVAHAQEPFARVVEAMPFRSPQLPVYANLTGQQYPTDPSAIKEVLKAQMTSSVRFKEEIESIYADGGYCFVEIGPRSVLTHLVEEILGDRPHLAIALNASRQQRSDLQFSQAVMQLRVAGLSLNQTDPYELEPRMPDEKAKLNFRLNGASYVSEKTRFAFETALKNGLQKEIPADTPDLSISSSKSSLDQAYSSSVQPPSQPSNGHRPYQNDDHKTATQNGHVLAAKKGRSPGLVDRSTAIANPLFNDSKPAAMQPQTDFIKEPNQPLSPQQHNSEERSGLISLQHYQKTLHSFEQGIAQYGHYQSDALKVHQQYLDNQSDYAKGFFQLMQQQNELLLGRQANQQSAEVKVAVMESLERSIHRFHDHQASTLQAHEQSLGYCTEHSRNVFQLMQQQYTLLTARPAGVGVPTLGAAVALHQDFDWVETTAEASATASANAPETPSMAEPLSPQQSQVPAVNNRVPGDPPTLSTKVFHPLVEAPPSSVVAERESQPDGLATELALRPISASGLVLSQPASLDTVTLAVEIDIQALSQAMLEVVSEKTGYPVEMLEMDMDMEADLGIDSLKRVEIIGGLMDRFPHLPQPNIAELAEMDLRTLGQVVGYMQKLSETGLALPTAETQELPPKPSKPMNTNGGLNDGGAAEIVPSEYPSRMLSSGMSPPMNSGLEQSQAGTNTAILDRVVSAVAVAEKPNVLPSPTKSGHSTAMTELGIACLQVVSEKTGYPVNALSLDLDLESDLGIDLVQQVDVISTLSEQFSDLQWSASESFSSLGLQTLGQVIERLQTLIAPGNQFTDGPQQPIPRSEVVLKFLPSPDWLEIALPQGHICLLTDDGTEMTASLSSSLRAQGWPVVVLSFPQSVVTTQASLPIDIPRVVLPELSEAALQRHLDMIAAQHGPVAAFIHLNPAIGGTAGQVEFLEAEAALVKQVFLMAKHLKSTLAQPTGQDYRCFFTVARLDGAFGLSQQMNFGAIGAGLFGLVKSLNYEWPTVFCRALDLSPELTVQIATQNIMAELHDPNRVLAEVSYGVQGRATLTCEP